MFDFYTLANGVRIVGERTQRTRAFALGAFVGCGPRCETARTNGISHFLEHMMFRGAYGHTSREIDWLADAMGADINAYTAIDHSCYYIDVMSTHLADAVELMCDVLTAPDLNPDDIERERSIILEEIAMSADSDEDRAADILYRRKFRGSPLGMTVLGPASNVRRFTRPQLRRQKDRTFAGANMCIAVAGNYDWAALISALERRLNALPAGEKPASAPYECAHTGISRVENGAEQTQLLLAFPGARLDSSDSAALELAANMLGGMNSSTLMQRVREELGLAYSVYAHNMSYSDYGELTIGASTSPDKAQRLLDETRGTLLDMAGDGFDGELFELARQNLKHVLLMDAENHSARMMDMGEQLLRAGYVRSVDETIAQLEAVTPDDARSALRSALRAGGCAAFYGQGVKKLRFDLQF